MRMDIALLNVRIVFQKSETVTDSIGNHLPQWVEYYVCYATVGGEGGSETVAAGTTVENADISFTVRFCKAVDAVTTTGFRVLFRDELYDILSVDHMNYKRKAVKFRCRKARR